MKQYTAICIIIQNMGFAYVAIKGVYWITLLRVFTRIITFVRLAILGRVLTPAQFGSFGIASLFLSLLEILTETGINVFLVQEKRQIKEYINSAWVISILKGIILGIAIFISAPFIAYFFNAGDAYSVIALIALVPIIRGFINPAIITYQKELLFQKEFTLRFLLFFVDVVISVLIGVLTRSATSFVYGLIASAIVETTLSYVLIPLWPKLKLSYKQVEYILRRSWNVTLTGIFSYLADNGDNITVGKLLDTSTLGIYQVAYKFSTFPISEITNVVNQVIFPVYTKFSEDKKRLRKAFFKVTVLSSLAAFVLGGAIFFFAKSLILVLMGEQWVLAVPAIQILAIYGVLRTIFGNFAPLFLSVRRQDFVAQMTFFRVVGLFITVMPLVMRYGMAGAGYAMLISILVEIPIILFFTYNIFKPR